MQKYFVNDNKLSHNWNIEMSQVILHDRVKQRKIQDNSFATLNGSFSSVSNSLQEVHQRIIC